MKWRMPIGVVLVVIEGDTRTAAARMEGAADVPSGESEDSSPRLFLAPPSGLTLAVGLVLPGRRHGQLAPPTTSDVRPANPWSDQPAQHGDPPKGLV